MQQHPDHIMSTSPLDQAIQEYTKGQEKVVHAKMAIEYKRAYLVANTRNLFSSEKKRGRYIAGQLGIMFRLLAIHEINLATKKAWLKRVQQKETVHKCNEWWI